MVEYSPPPRREACDVRNSVFIDKKLISVHIEELYFLCCIEGVSLSDILTILSQLAVTLICCRRFMFLIPFLLLRAEIEVSIVCQSHYSKLDVQLPVACVWLQTNY